MRIPSLPPHVGWPLLVVGLLSISITASVYTLFAAQSDGGPAIIRNYYQKSKTWNETAQARQRGTALDVSLSVRPASADASHDPSLRPVVVTVRDSSGAPVPALQGRLRLFRPQTAGALATIPLSPVSSEPGVYRQLLPIQSTGLWDVELDATIDGHPVTKTLRIEVR